ncbi:hypothetical protein [Helicobacter sp. 11S02596-1]|uniref:hypothetical protein n=1 Tax=Helicobacter sp. 11S02596-1 TaxID=1476194 RepID=UPI000BA6491A|nr:hypothetical protein [Helicobacter sp. 11S02596-1]PAF43972.1 hypothetical protein BJI48_04090 [Helicobacter sp. 11S02596-1]
MLWLKSFLLVKLFFTKGTHHKPRTHARTSRIRTPYLGKLGLGVLALVFLDITTAWGKDYNNQDVTGGLSGNNTFTNSSFTGNITNNGVYIFNGNSTGKKYAFKGDIASPAYGLNINVTFNQGAIANVGKMEIGYSGYSGGAGRHITINIAGGSKVTANSIKVGDWGDNEELEDITFLLTDSSLTGNATNRNQGSGKKATKLNFNLNNSTYSGTITNKNQLDFVATNRSIIGNITGQNNPKTYSNITLNNIASSGNIDVASNSGFVKLTNIKDATIGNINSNALVLTGDFSSSNVGNLTSTNADSIVSFDQMQGKTIGSINLVNGKVTGTLDFTPKDSKTLNIGSNIIANEVDLNFVFGGPGDSVNKALSNKNKNSVGILKTTATNVTQTTGHINLDGLGTFDFDNTISNTFETILSNKTNLNLNRFEGTLGLVRTNIVLNQKGQTHSIFGQTLGKDLGIIDKSTHHAKGFSNAVFGNAMLVYDENGKQVYNADGTPKIMPNVPETPSGGTPFYTITQKGAPTDDGFVSGKSSNGSIGVEGDELKKHISFVFTENTFNNTTEKGFTGTIDGGTDDSLYEFYNAGQMNAGSVANAKGVVNLFNTTITGILGQTIAAHTSATGATIPEQHPNVTTYFDYSKNGSVAPNAYGLAVIGQGEHHFEFDFTDNDASIKFAGSLLGGSAAGTNTITFYNLDGLNNATQSKNPQAGASTQPHGILNALNNAGFTAINNQTPAINESTPGTATENIFKDFESKGGTIDKSDLKDIPTNTQMNFYGSTFKGDLVENNYAFNLNFYGNQNAINAFIKALNDEYDKEVEDAKKNGTPMPTQPLPGLKHTLKTASFDGDTLDLSGNSNDATINFIGSGSIKPGVTNPADKAIKVALGSGNNILNIQAVDGVVALQTKETSHTASATGKLDGNKSVFVQVDSAGNQKSFDVSKTTLNISQSSLIGDWSQGKALELSFGEDVAVMNTDGTPKLDGSTPVVNHTKFYGVLSTDGNQKMKITLGQNSLYDPNHNASDRELLKKYYNGSLKTNTTDYDKDPDGFHFGAVTIRLGNASSANNTLIINNPGGELHIDGLDSTHLLSGDSSLMANNTTIVGNIYGAITTSGASKVSNIPVNLSFNNTGVAFNTSGNLFDFSKPSAITTPNPIPTYYQGDVISGIKDGSSLSFIGKGSLRPLTNQTLGTSGLLGTIPTGTTIEFGQQDQVLNLLAYNTGGTLSFEHFKGNIQTPTGNYHIKGTNLVVKDNFQTTGASTADKKTSVRLAFAKASNDDLLTTKDGSLLTSDTDSNGNQKDIRDYILPSSLTLNGGILIRLGEFNATFIGDESILPLRSNNVLSIGHGNNAITAYVNAINMGDALKSSNAATFFGSALSAANATGASWVYNVRGSNIGTISVGNGANASKAKSIVFNASFDNRDFLNRDEADRYWTNENTMGNTELVIVKSSLSGTLTLANNVEAHLEFFGDALGGSGSVTGGKNTSSMLIDGAERTKETNSSVKFSALSQFGGKINVMNTELSDGFTGNNGKFSKFQMTFNAKMDEKTLSAQAKEWIEKNVNQTDSLGVTHSVDFSHAHVLGKEVQGTGNHIDLVFIGQGAFIPGTIKQPDGSYKNKTGSIKDGFFINNGVASANNTYTFVDAGVINLREFTDASDNTASLDTTDPNAILQSFKNQRPFSGKGVINWVGRSYQEGKITNAINTEDSPAILRFSDFVIPTTPPASSATSGTDWSDPMPAYVFWNIYQAGGNDPTTGGASTGGGQHLEFDFGGNAAFSANPDATNPQDYKFQGYITQGSATEKSSYTFSNLGTIDTANNDDFIDVLNRTINPANTTSPNTTQSILQTNNPIQIISGTIGLKDTSVNGDIAFSKNPNWATTGLTPPPTGLTLALSFDNNHPYYGENIRGDGNKVVNFQGAQSFQKATMKIHDGSDDSIYNFNDVGVLDQNSIDNILNKLQTQGNFSFQGETKINANIFTDVNPSLVKTHSLTLGDKDHPISVRGNAEQQGLQKLSEISTIVQIHAFFGDGSRVDIQNQNAGSSYDFSNFAGRAPVIATINLNTQKTDKTDTTQTDDGIKKATITGFDGNVSLIGSIQDTDQTITEAGGTTDNRKANTYVFGSATPVASGTPGTSGAGVKNASWVVTADSNVQTLQAGNADEAQQKLALNDNRSIGNVGSIIDLRGLRDNSLPSENSLAGAVTISPKTAKTKIQQNPAFHLLGVGDLTMNYGVVRLGVNANTGNSDLLEAQKVSGGDNLLQIALEAGKPQDAKAVLAIIHQNDVDDYFSGVDYTQGVYTLTPNIRVQNSGASGPLTIFYLDGFAVAANLATTNAFQNALGVFYRDFRIATDNLNLRMGELRGQNLTQGAWAKFSNGLGSDNARNRDFQTTLQAGYDHQFSFLNGTHYLGVSAEGSFIASKGALYHTTGKNIGLGLYDALFLENGFYIDSTLKYLYTNNRFSFDGDSDIVIEDSKSSLGSQNIIAGVELGYRYELDRLFGKGKEKNAFIQGYFLEPQAQVIYGYNTGTRLEAMVAGERVQASLQANNALISRVGAVFGKHFKTKKGMVTDVRLGLSYINELNTGGNTNIRQFGAAILPDIVYQTPMNNKLNLSLGANFIIDDSWRAYAEVSRTFLGVYQTDYNLSLGARFSFGKKVSALERTRRWQQQKQHKIEHNHIESKVIPLPPKQNCQGCPAEDGYYLQVAALAKEPKDLLPLLKTQSYRTQEIKLIRKNKKGKTETITAHRYLIGPFKTAKEAREYKQKADEIVKKFENNPNGFSLSRHTKKGEGVPVVRVMQKEIKKTPKQTTPPEAKSNPKVKDLFLRVAPDKEAKPHREDKKTTPEAPKQEKTIDDKTMVLFAKNGSQTHCQGCAPEVGYYLQVAVLTQEDKEALALIGQYSYRVEDFALYQNGKSKLAHRYLIGPFKTAKEAHAHKKEARKLVFKIHHDPKMPAIMYEVKNDDGLISLWGSGVIFYVATLALMKRFVKDEPLLESGYIS